MPNRFSPTDTPDKILQLMQRGNERFITGAQLERNFLSEVLETKLDQSPHSVVLSCIDSRVPIEIVFDQGIGDVFSIRIAGNIVNDDIIASMEFATKVKGTKLLLVLGHTGCGAIAGACNHVELGHLPILFEKINPSIARFNELSLSKDNMVDKVAELNVEAMVEVIREKSPIIRELEQQGKVLIACGMYDLATGKVAVKPASVQV